MTFSLDEIEELDEEEHRLLPDEAHEDAADVVVDEKSHEEGFGDGRSDKSAEPDGDSQEDEEEEPEETLPPPVLPRFIEVEPFRPYEADNTAYADAVNAYYEEKNYEQAIEKFGDAIENEMQQTVGNRTRHNQIIAKSLYWQAEAYVKMQDIPQAILTFESLIQTCKGHYLTVAAERRAEQLKSTKAVSA